MNDEDAIPLRPIPITDLPDVEILPDDLGRAIWLEALRMLENRLHLQFKHKGYTS
jgi:hypothetical protein